MTLTELAAKRCCIYYVLVCRCFNGVHVDIVFTYKDYITSIIMKGRSVYHTENGPTLVWC